MLAHSISAAPLRRRRASLLAGCAAMAAISGPAAAQSAFKATPEVVVGGIETSPGQTIPGGLRDTVQVFTRQSVIDWTPDDIATGGGAISILPQGNELVFTANPADLGGAYTVLNRVIPNDPSRPIQFDGLVKSQFDSGYGATSGGNIWFYSPGGIIAGATGRFDVGSLVLSANDIDFSNGLFGDGSESQSGTIRFRGTADSKSFVTVQPGAQLNAAGNYIALVAPRITQGGTLTVNGSAALVAAESADITIPVSSGLFDIAVSVGSKVDSAGETTLAHTGSTLISAPAATGQARRVYLMALPKNDAVTMLVSGTLGYDAASQAQVANGAIVLTTGSAVPASGGVETYTPGQSDIHVTGGNFSGAVSVLGKTLTLDTSTADLNATSLDLFATGGGSILIKASDGRDISVANAVQATGFYVGPSTLTEVTVSADAGSTIHVGSLSVQLESSGLDELCACDFATAATGVPISLSATGGIITADTDIFLSSFGRGGFGNNNPGAKGTGGTIDVAASSGGRISVGRQLALFADGQGGDSVFGVGDAAGMGMGGTARVLASGGNIEAGGIAVRASGTGGFGGLAGGTGQGGVATISAEGGTITVRDVSAAISASARGGSGSATSGAVKGGTAQLLVGGAGSSANFQGGVRLSAAATGNSSDTADIGGDAVGGSVIVSATGGSLSASKSEGFALSLDASATGGFGSTRSGNASGGNVAITLTGTKADLGDVRLTASADTVEIAESEALFPPLSANGGDATGGTATLSFTNATTTMGLLSLTLDAQAGGGFDLTTGNGTGGTGALSVTGGSLSLASVEASALGRAGDSLNGFGSAAVGGAGTGGTLALNFSGVSPTTLNGLVLDTTASGGNAHAGGEAIGGTISLTASAGAALQVAEGIDLYADAFGGAGLDAGGAATGGTITLLADGGSIAAGFVTAQASGFGGLAFDASGPPALQVDGAAAAATASGFAGNGTGGNVVLISQSGGAVATPFEVIADGLGGDADAGLSAGDGTGGIVTIKAIGGAIDFGPDDNRIRASGEGGGAASGAVSPIGRGGRVTLELNAGNTSDPASEVMFGSLLLDAHGGGSGFRESFIIPRNSAVGIGGTASLTLNSGSLSGASLELRADGLGGLGDTGTEAGRAFQGRAEFAQLGGSAALTDSLLIHARAFGGQGLEESGYGAAGSGGTAGIGANPFGPGAGAYAEINGGQLTASLVQLVADSQGGEGGAADQFAMTPGDAGAGGQAMGGVAKFVSSGSAILDASTITVSALGIGGAGGDAGFGNGGSLEPGTVGGTGGTGTGGLALAQLGSDNFTANFVEVDARGLGGAGGSVLFSGEGLGSAPLATGGTGGDAIGGEATAFLLAGSGSGLTIFANASGDAASGADGPVGGRGGFGKGGVAAVNILGGTHDLNQVSASAQGLGGSGADGGSFDGGDGGDALGGNASVRVGGGDATTGFLTVEASASAGFGGDGGFNLDDTAPRAGGRGGSATGGQAALFATGGVLRVQGVESSASFSSSGFGGDGGQGGAAGNGGDAGNGAGGAVVLNASGRAIEIGRTDAEADGSGGFGGGGAAAGLDGEGAGGSITVLAADVPNDGIGLSLDLGEAELSADGRGATPLAATIPGQITIQASTAAADPVLRFFSLSAHAEGDSYNPESGSSITTIASGAAISVASSASYRARGPVAFQLSGAGALSAANSIHIESGETIAVQHAGNGAGHASISGSAIFTSAGGSIFADPGSLLSGSESVDLRAFGGSIEAAAIKGGSIDVGAASDVTIGSVTGDAISVFAGQADGESAINAGRNVTISGPWHVGDASVGATGDVIAAAGAQLIADRAITLNAGDDVLIRSGALVRAADDAPPETGYGLSDPLQQRSQLRLLAGSDFSGEPADQQLGSIIIDDAVEAPDRTIFMSAGAVSGVNSTLTAGNLYVRLFNVPVGDQVPSNDGGQLTGACLEGSVCFGTTNVSGLVRIGESGFEPINLRLKGGIDGTDVLLRARSVELGEAGTAHFIRATDGLVIEAQAESLVLKGPLAIAAGSGRVASARNIEGAAATLGASGTLDLFAGTDITLSGIEAASIRTVDFDGAIGNAHGITVPGTISVGRIATASDLSLDAGGDIALDSLDVQGAATLNSLSGTISVASDAAATGGIAATAESIALTGQAGLTITQAVARSGDLSLVAQEGITADIVSAAGTATLKSGTGPLKITTDIVAGQGLILAAPSVDITAENGLNILQADATVGDLVLKTEAGVLAAGSSTATGAILLVGKGGISFASLSGQQGVTLSSDGLVTGGAINAVAGGVTANGAKGLAVDTLAASGPVTLGASAGAITVATDIASGGRVQANAQSISLRAIGDLVLDQGSAASIVLASANGGVTLGQVSASEALTVTAPGTISVTGRTDAGTIAFTSSDLAIGSAGQLGSTTQTTNLTLTSTADRLLLGDAAGSGYRIDAAEFTRITSGGDLTIVSAPSSAQAAAFGLLDPSGTNVVVGSMAFDGAQLGTTGIFRVTTPRSIGFTGNAQFKNFGNGQTVTYSALNDISLASETGLVTVKNASGGLAGTLRLEAQQVHALSTKARSEIAGLGLNDVRQRLGTNDQIENDGGYFQAGAIVVRIGRLVFIQNSGANGDSPDVRRGFTANSFAIESTGEAPAQVVVNGRVGTASGAAVIDSTMLTGSFDAQSTFNGCVAGADCGEVAPPPPLPVPNVTPVLIAARDQVPSDEKKDETEESLEAAQTRPDPVIQFVGTPSSRLDPLIDEPVTGAGNEDLWLTPTDTTPRR